MLLKLSLIPVILTTIYLLSLQLSTPPKDLKPKIFVLGLSKTGTTSVGNALALLGYKRIGWKDIRSRHLVHTYLNGDLSALIEQTHYFDAFEDLPWPYIYREMAEMYPDAKFVLTLRKDEETWLRSWIKHHSRGVWEPAGVFFGVNGAEWKESDREVVLSSYREHTAKVREFFADKQDRYVELVVDDGDANWEVLCRVAQCPGGKVPTVEFPKSNTAEQWKDESPVGNLHRLWGYTITRIEETTARIYYQEQWCLLNRLLDVVWRYISVIEFACCQVYFKLVVQNEELLPPT